MMLYTVVQSDSFNNIFSTESLSPVSFYEKRNFGYRNYKKSELIRDNFIVFFTEQISTYDQNWSGENFPVTVAISDELLDTKFKKDLGNGIFAYSKTVYFRAQSDKTRFIFRNEEEQNEAIACTLRSRDSKMVDFYKENGCFTIFQETNLRVISESDLKVIDSNCSISETTVEESVLSDNYIDKVKGAVYGYIIGTILGERQDYIIKKRLLSAVFNQNFCSPNIDKSKLLSSYKSLLGDIEVSCKKSFREDLYEQLTHLIRNAFEIYVQISDLKRKKSSSATESQLSYFEDQLKSLRNRVDALLTEKYKDVISSVPDTLFEELPQLVPSFNTQSHVELRFSRKDCKLEYLHTFIESLMNETLFTEKNSEFRKFSERDVKITFVSQIAAPLLKELNNKYVPNRWDKNLNYSERKADQKLINQLLNNLQNSSEIDEKLIKSKVMRAFIIFAQQGEALITNMENCLLQAGAHKDVFAFAYSLWGALFGYSGIDKVSMNLFSDSDKNKVLSIYEKVNENLKNLIFSDNEDRVSYMQRYIKRLQEDNNYLNKIVYLKQFDLIDEKYEDKNKNILTTSYETLTPVAEPVTPVPAPVTQVPDPVSSEDLQNNQDEIKEESKVVAEDKLQDNDYQQRICELDKKFENVLKEKISLTKGPQDGKIGSDVCEFCKFIYEIENREKFKNLEFQENEISKDEFVLAWKEFCIYLIEKDKNFSKKIQNSIKAFTPKQEESLKFDGAGDLYSKLLKEFEKKYIKKFFANYYSKELCFVFGKVKINLEDIISTEPNKTENEGEG